MSKRKRDKIKAKERRHNRSEGSNLTVIRGGSGKPSVKGELSGSEQLAMEPTSRTVSAAAKELAAVPDLNTAKRRGRPPKSNVLAETASNKSNAAGPRAAMEQAPERTIGSLVPRLDEEGLDAAREPKKKRGSGKKKQTIDWTAELDLEASPHLREMTPAWQQLYALVGRVARREER
ncbi:hypothetical protein WMW72_24595 [Paenibacillus filicis]|uniref:Ribosome biogenesis protein SLX9 n=1 Tax=Paenibacillus filicis TaxID=669464 RepID=A0ABU9DQH4_9BACL